MKRSYLFLLLITILMVSKAYSTTYTSTQNGDWLNVTTWSPFGIPIPGDIVVINHDVVLDTSFAYTTGSITINSSGSLVQDSPVRDIWLNGTNATFTNNGSVTIRNMLLSAGNFTNTNDFNVKTVANYITLDNTVTGVFNGVDSLFNDGTLNNNGIINIMTFYNDDTFNNYGIIQGLSTVVDSMYNNGTFLNDVGAVLYADSCINSNGFVNNGVINFNQFTNIATFTNNNYVSLSDMTNFGTFTNKDSLLGAGSITNVGNLDNQAGAIIDLSMSFLNVDTVNNNATLTANGRFVIGDSFYNFNIINGSAPGSIQVQDSSYNNGVMSGTFDFCDLTPPSSAPFIDFNPGTFAGTITFCTVTGINKELSENIIVFPNPATNHINIETDKGVIVDIYNMIGEKVITTSQTKIDISQLTNNIYIMRISNIKGELLKQEKIIKQ